MTTKVVSDAIKPFTGEGDVVSWLKKVELVAKLQKISDLASLIPLYLEGNALALYLEMSETDKASAAKIEERLLEAFTDDIFTAYGKLAKLRWTGEPVDVYANELRRLAGLAGFTGDALESIVRLNFVNGFPDNLSTSLQQISGIKTMAMSEIISKARVLASKSSSSGLAAVSAQVVDRQRMSQSGSVKDRFDGRVFKGQCYRCGGPHMARFCKEQRVIICFRCNKQGHMANQCGQGNEMRGTGAPAVSPGTE